ncbi:conserved hypothetical protein [Microsporum canis CBS 113480]|uniref:Uncharacterized protein n=1 Tax=Arthroderma otae (strain ATCC MYA-4605 / CBS 113480) TaxID=554155 RepID=C5FYV1_ARTOC|nr:conserved hypothetical protein [Microsporum canis CBS 113480]EEQ34699.1 conserved hypothetical protein [Microsporum canis CBS 113480]
MDQGYAALSAALMLPLSNSRRHHIRLSIPKQHGESTGLKERQIDYKHALIVIHNILRDARLGLIPVELHAAIWTGTMQSFIQEPIARPPIIGGRISRAHDEDGKPIHHTYDKGLTPTFPEPPQELPHIPISYKAFDLEEESASEDATRNLFCWLWLEGYPGNEKEVYSHEWFDLGDSGEADEEALCGNSELSYCSRCRSLAITYSTIILFSVDNRRHPRPQCYNLGWLTLTKFVVVASQNFLARDQDLTDIMTLYDFDNFININRPDFDSNF